MLASSPRIGLQIDVGNAKSAIGYAGTLQCMALIPDNSQIDCLSAIDDNSVCVSHAFKKAQEGLSSINNMIWFTEAKMTSINKVILFTRAIVIQFYNVTESHFYWSLQISYVVAYKLVQYITHSHLWLPYISTHGMLFCITGYLFSQANTSSASLLWQCDGNKLKMLKMTNLYAAFSDPRASWGI